MRTILLTVIAAAALISTAAAEDLTLACPGSGTYQDASGTTATLRDNRTGQTASVYGNTTGQGSLPQATVQFELNGDTARILMPPAMTPQINVGSDGGWWTLDRLSVTPEEIAGRFTLNIFNKPRVRIDRMRGTIEVDGNFHYYFLGECQRGETPTQPRF